MKRMRHAPTEYYCELLRPIDEQICGLLSKRKNLSNNNPGFPHLHLISSWCQQFELSEELMQSIFSSLYHEKHFFPIIEPTGFIKFLPVLKSVEVDGVLYAVTHIKQYRNASVVHVEAEWNEDDKDIRRERMHFQLFISKEYTCRPNGGCGSDKSMQNSFVVSPPLPDDVTGLEFRITVKPHLNDRRPHQAPLDECAVVIK